MFLKTFDDYDLEYNMLWSHVLVFYLIIKEKKKTFLLVCSRQMDKVFEENVIDGQYVHLKNAG